MSSKEVLETFWDGRKVMVYIFSKHFMLRWYSQLRLGVENDHFFDGKPRFLFQISLWDQIWGIKSYHFCPKLIILKYATSCSSFSTLRRIQELIFGHDTNHVWNVRLFKKIGETLPSTTGGGDEAKSWFSKKNGNFWHIKSDLRGAFALKIQVPRRKNARSQRSDGVGRTTAA